MKDPGHVLHWIRRVKRHDTLCAEQLISPSTGEPPTSAALLDQWGRAHCLKYHTLIGREPGACDIAILEGSVSRAHAKIRYDEARTTWTICDLDSTNGTFLEGARLKAPADLEDGSVVTIGDVSLAFHSCGAKLFDRSGPDSIKRTSRRREHEGPELTLLGVAPAGAGVVECDGIFVELGTAQYALMEELANRLLKERERDPQIRGFVDSGQLLAGLPWLTPHPEDNNLKQLVRRTRRAFDRAGLEDPIESRRGFGYRLRWIPAIENS